MLVSIVLTFVSSSFATPLTYNPHQSDITIIPDKYIVKFRDHVSTLSANDLKVSLSNPATHEYSMSTFRGFAGTLTITEKARLEASVLVEYIEFDSVMHTTDFVEQDDAPWGLARISSHTPGGTTYTYDETAGEGTCAYVIDTGIDIEHPDFEGRAEFLINTSRENCTTDEAGHGTHVAGTIGSKTYGVAKKTVLIAIKVLDGQGTGTKAGIIAGFQAAADDAPKRKDECKKGLVANISLGGGLSQSVNDAAKAITAAGVFVAVAAGNYNDDAAHDSPASEPSVCTVGASAQNDTRAYFSNYGPLVDVFAPGLNITSLWLNHTVHTISGTSMASPHVAGLGAYLLGLGAAEVGEVCEKIRELAIQDVVGDVPEGTDNLLVYNDAETE
ncbi:elastase-like serine protease [Ophiobolus disseminans]|uniref:Elastase-like serine protease n=1 Tax=Ophiobolus disseminans TaxID=1469910 RepID=A0A6A7AAM2_9PLEO|nr:elastase-like serine protease [Ophiobolus disseminans]